PTGYNGTFTIASIVDSTHFTYALTTPQGMATVFGTATVPGPTHSGPTGGNSTGDLVVNFTPTAGGSGAVFMVWGGHLAQSAYWFNNAPPNGAGQISGAPWHMRTQNLTDAGVTSGGKNQDRSIQPSALVQKVTPTLSTAIFTSTNQPVTSPFHVPL